MKIEELRVYFGTFYRAAKITRMSIQSFQNWKKRGYIPINSQMKIEEITKGRLVARLEDCKSD